MRWASGSPSRPAISALPIPDPETELRYVMDAVRTIKKALGDRCPLIGFAGSPWTLATYMVEGRGGQEFARIKRMRFEDPSLLDALLDTLVRATTEYLLAQAAAGADALMVFDTWGGVLDHAGYRQFSLAPMQNIVAAIKAQHPALPVILFTKNGGQQLEAMAATGCDALGLDWTTDIAQARRRVGEKVALQGNLDPLTLLASPVAIRDEVARVLEGFGHGPGHVFNLGHGITPEVDPDHAAAIIDVTIVYQPTCHSLLWSWLIGEQNHVRVVARTRPLPVELLAGQYAQDAAFRDAFQGWVNALWAEKDAALSRP